jgi:thiamine pyrophosphokinase
MFEPRLWSLADVIYCADGSANRLHDSLFAVGDNVDDREQYLPHAICGDLDSIRCEVADYYRSSL